MQKQTFVIIKYKTTKIVNEVYLLIKSINIIKTINTLKFKKVNSSDTSQHVICPYVSSYFQNDINSLTESNFNSKKLWWLEAQQTSKAGSCSVLSSHNHHYTPIWQCSNYLVKEIKHSVEALKVPNVQFLTYLQNFLSVTEPLTDYSAHILDKTIQAKYILVT